MAGFKRKGAPEDHKLLEQDLLADYEAKGFGAVRKAREMTQVELAEKLGIDQAGVSAIENRSDPPLRARAKYIRALGGDLRLRAIFPEMTFNLEPFPPAWLNEGERMPVARRRQQAVAAPGLAVGRKTAARQVVEG